MDNDQRALEDLARRLGDERQVVTYLLYKLTVTHLMLAADERRFVPDALEEVERAVELLREGEMRRDASLRELSSLWMVDPGTLTLAELVRRSPPPFDHVFADHLAAFRDLAGEIERTAGENRVLAQGDLAGVTHQLDQLTGSAPGVPTTYDAQGQLDGGGVVGGRLREVL